MLINRFGSSTVIEDTTYTIGMRICGTDASEYEGLFGSILEIRDGEDKETENETVDIICYFDPPENSFKVKQLEERFSELYDMKKVLDDISLDYVIMAADMIRAVKRCRIYQIEPPDTEYVFRGLDVAHKKGLHTPPGELYKVVFDGQLETDDIEDIFTIFNVNHPQGYRGRSLSMSDIVEFYDDSGSSFFYCDTGGFKEVPFTPVVPAEPVTDNRVIHYRLFNTDYAVSIHVGVYPNNANLAVCLLSADDEEYGSPFTDVTKNLDIAMPYYCGAVKNYSENEGMIDFLRANGLGEPTGDVIKSGYVSMPIVQFNRERLKALNADGCIRYEERFNRKK